MTKAGAASSSSSWFIFSEANVSVAATSDSPPAAGLRPASVEESGAAGWPSLKLIEFEIY
jgi:hypothetical protein